MSERMSDVIQAIRVYTQIPILGSYQSSIPIRPELGRIALPERKIRIFTPNFGARKDFQYFFQGAQKYLERK